MDDVYNNIDDFQPTKKRKNLIVFDDIIADITTNIKFHTIIQELFIRCRKLNISLVFTTQSYFSAPKEARLNSTHYSITKIYNKREPQQIVINHSEDIDYKYFMFTKNVQVNHILFSLLILHYLLMILSDLEKIFHSFTKTTLIDELKILDDKIKAN